ncbi:probable long-chain-alcohol O-fatty-acyltransferase 5, partial [Amaranthus tricolor]|uniref:probable long-chain-alcohol O-fatty-acyltransferase 5 n=1 Tax=Amaranthus tricolor TaxID=29722 RepID=UPI002584BA58
MEEETKNFFKAWLVVFISLSYTYFISSKIPKGIFRFISLIPIFYQFILLPLSIYRPIPSVILSGFITWIANSKLLLYTFNLGPLSTYQSQSSFLRFIIFGAFPIKIKENTSKDQKGSLGHPPKNVLPLNFWSKTIIFIIFYYYYIYHHKKNMIILACLLYLFIDIVLSFCHSFVGSTLGLELDPPFDEPYISTSLQDFWGNRWNLMISDALRHTVYFPVKLTAVKLVGRMWAPSIAVMACFVVSGLMHEVIYYNVTRVPPTWEVTWFFIMHGVCVLLEMAVKRNLGPEWRLHWAISGPLTVGFVMGTGFWLFFPPLIRNHVDVKAIDDIMEFGICLKEVIM